MAEETSTRTVLRRKICKELRMPFFRRVGSSSTANSSSTTSRISDNKLTQPEGTWAGSWFYSVTHDEQSYIRSFTANDDMLHLERVLANDPISDTYEIHTVWNASEVHDAINEAIRLGRRTFPETVTDETIVLKEEVMTYSVTGLSKLPYIINKIWVENIQNAQRGAVVSSTNTSITLDAVPSDLTTTWRVSIYAGTGAGQSRQATSTPTGNTFSVSTWTTNPDSTSKYVLFNQAEELTTWRPFNDFHQDTEEFPDTIYLNKLYTSYYGMRLRIEMLAVSQELTTEAGTTNVPSEYIKAKACSILHGQAMSNTKADKDMHYAEYKRYGEEADAYIARSAPHTPGVRFRAGITTHTYQNDNLDPLGWSN